MKTIKFWAGTLALAAAVGFGSAQTAQAGILDGALGKVVKVGGIGFLVKQFGPQINKTINTLLQQKGIRYEDRTKVVPTFAVGSGAYVGGAQIQGEETVLKKAKYVATIEVPVGRARGKAYFPVNSLTPGKAELKPIQGVGTTAIIDFRI
ncbi:MAG: hypothetical protein ACK47B_05910 [Armatimonadota bacterium]